MKYTNIIALVTILFISTSVKSQITKGNWVEENIEKKTLKTLERAQKQEQN